MARRYGMVVVMGAGLTMAGCSFTSDAMFPSLFGDEEPAPPPQTYQIPPAAAEANTQPTVSTYEESPWANADRAQNNSQAAASNIIRTSGRDDTNYSTPMPRRSTGDTTGTVVGDKVGTIRRELRQLQATIATHQNQLQDIRESTADKAERYHGTVARINAKLQIGTTPGNPQLMQDWNRAQEQLNAMTQDIAKLNQLATEVASDSAWTSYLQDSVRAAFSLPGGVEEDHNQLRLLEDEVNQTVVLIERTLSELNRDTQRHQQYTANEEANLNALAVGIKNGQLYGGGYTPAAVSGTRGMMDQGMAPASFGASASAGGRPLVTIRFDRPDVSYDQALYQAVSRALERRPDAMFELVAVTPAGQNSAQGTAAAKRHAEAVLRSLANMGLPTSRVQLAAMGSAAARTNEVHLYIR